MNIRFNYLYRDAGNFNSLALDTRALARLSELMPLAPFADTQEGDEIDVLALLIEKHEMEAFPDGSPMICRGCLLSDGAKVN